MRDRHFGIVSFTAFVLAVSTAAAAPHDLRLIDAARHDDLSEARALVAAGADVNAHWGDGSTALHWAAQKDDAALADLLISKGAKVDAATDLGVTPLWVAAGNASPAMVERLLKAHANANSAPPTGQTPLMIAARRGDAQVVKSLLGYGADPNAKEAAHGQTALMWASSERHPDVVRALLEARADTRVHSKSWTQNVNVCCQETGNDEITAVVPRGGYTSLHFAAQYGDVETVRLLVGAHADLNEPAADGTSPLVVAAHVGQTDVAKALLDAGADPNAAGAGYNALHLAATRGDVDLVQALLAHGADVNARQMKGSPTKRVASGHSMDHRTIGATPFILAARSGRLEVMKLLAAKGADLSLQTQDGRNALVVLASHGTVEGPRFPDQQAAEVIKLAVQLGTPVNEPNANGDTALHVAATLRRDVIVQALVDAGAALDARNHAGETPLALALKPPVKRPISDVVDEYHFLLNHTQTAELLKKLGGKT